MAADAFVEVHHHCDLSADLHDAASSGGPVHRVRMIKPLDLVELADDDELVAVRAHCAVVVEAVGELGIAADHVGRLEHVRVTELWMPPRRPVICEPGTFTIFSCA